MKYEKPQVTVLTAAIGAIQSSQDGDISVKNTMTNLDNLFLEHNTAAYADWED